MNHFFDALLSPIAPHACVACGTTGNLLCMQCLDLMPETLSKCYRCSKATTNYETCVSCHKVSPLEAIYICTDYETAAKALIQKLKFERTYASASIIAQIMARQLDALPQDATLSHVPTATSRVRQRGYDQAKLIAKALAGYRGMSYAPILVRLGQQRQTNSSRTERLHQLQDAFIAKSRVQKIDHVLLVDDILTTGSTLEAAARTLKAAGVPKVSAVVFARAL
jgi:ComF family protein